MSKILGSCITDLGILLGTAREGRNNCNETFYSGKIGANYKSMDADIVDSKTFDRPFTEI